MLLRVLVWESSGSRAIKRTAEMHVQRHSTFSCFLDTAMPDCYERYRDVLRWDEGLDEWGRLSQDGSIVCLSGDGVVGVLDERVKDGGKLGQWGGAKVYHQRSLASVNVRVSCSGEVSQRQAGSRLAGGGGDEELDFGPAGRGAGPGGLRLECG